MIRQPRSKTLTRDWVILYSAVELVQVRTWNRSVLRLARVRIFKSNFQVAQRMSKMNLTKDAALGRNTSALLVIDMQKRYVLPEFGQHSGHDGSDSIPEKLQYYYNRLRHTTVPTIKKLLDAFRKKKAEVIFSVVECLTKDGRDISLEYRLNDFLVPKGSAGAQVVEELAPQGGEMTIPKTTYSVFNSSNIENVLRVLGITQLVVVGVMTEQCVESSVRDAADRGFLVTVVDDACATFRQSEHDAAMYNFRKWFGRVRNHGQVVQELEDWSDENGLRDNHDR